MCSYGEEGGEGPGSVCVARVAGTATRCLPAVGDGGFAAASASVTPLSRSQPGEGLYNRKIFLKICEPYCVFSGFVVYYG